MKNISSQYHDFKNGTMSKEAFVRSMRMAFPKHISPSTSLNDAIHILKQKRLLSEVEVYREKEIIPGEVRKGINYELDLTYNMVPDWRSDFVDKAEMDRVTKRVVKNLGKDPLYYTKLIATGEKPGKDDEIETEIEYKESAVNDTTYKTKSDGHLKKVIKKDEKSNVSNRKENKSQKNAGIKVMSDKGVEGTEKIIEERIQISTLTRETLKELIRTSIIEILYRDKKTGQVQSIPSNSPVLNEPGFSSAFEKV